ncbi:MAG TPA: DNA polymerase III subunit beta, partial [Bacteroidales bacterium]|nr:DNA polymerase III subunit beta [Bacteroidales bacterium]
MEFIVSSSKLSQQLQIISKVIKAKPTLPVLEYFLFTIKDQELHITATDLETTIVCTLDLDNSQADITFTIESKRLLSILKEFAEQPLIFSVEKTKSENDTTNETIAVTIKTNSGIYQLMGDVADEFPKIPEIDENTAHKFTLRSEIFIKGLQTTLFATTNDEYRPVMNGIFCEIFEDQINMVATDAHKLVKYNHKNFENNFSDSFILPQKTALLLKNINPSEDDDLQIIFNEKNIFIQIENFQLIAQLIEGKFPNYQA